MRISLKSISTLILFLFALNFLNMESRIILILFCALMLINQGHRRWILPITRTSIVLGVFSIAFYAFAIVYDPSMTTYYIIPFLLGPFLGYSVGILLMRNVGSNRNKNLKIIIYTIVFGRFLHGLLNFIISNGYNGYLRNGIDYWTKSVIAATGQGALMTMAISLLFYGLFVLKKDSAIEKVVVLAAVALALMNSLLSASRTALIIMIIAFFASAIMYILFLGESRLKKNKMFMGILILFAVLAVFYQNDTLGVKTYWETTPLYERLNTESDYKSGDQNRMEMITDTLESAIDNPLGNGDMSATAHNLWLDILKQTGWLTFSLLVAYTIMVVKKITKLLKCQEAPKDVKYLVFSVALGTLLNFSVEPIMKGMPYYFVAFCIIAGAVEEYESRTADLV